MRSHSTLAVVVFALSVSVEAHARQATSPIQPPYGQTVTDSLSGPIRKHDVLRVTVVGEPAYSGEFRVDDDGTVTLPRVGQVLVANNPPLRAQTFIEKRLVAGKFLRKPDVVVQIINRKAQEITVGGAVQVQGRRVLREGARLSDVLEEANPALQADLEKVQLTRGTTPLTINYKKYRNGQEDSDTVNPPLEDGDRIYIRLGEPTEGSVKIIGEVKDITKPTVSIGAGATVSQVLGVVGGPTEFGNRKGIFVMRGSQRIDVPYEEIVAGATAKDVKLLDKDEVHIPRLEKPRQYTVFGGVQTKGAFPLQGKVTVLQAVANAGPVEGAKWKKDIRLSRPDKDGNYPKDARKVNLEKGNEAAMEVLDGDVIYVPDPSRGNKFDFSQAVSLFGNVVWISSLLRR